MKHFDGTERAPMPSKHDLALGAFSEFVAMTLFVFFGCGSASSNAASIAGEWDSASVTVIALQFGLLITVLAFATAHTSGGHINCAVTFALTIVGTCHPVRGAVYFVAQMLGSIMGALLLQAATDGDTSYGEVDRTGGLGSNGLQAALKARGGGTGNGFVVELMGTALLVYVVLETAVNTESVTTDGTTMIRGQKQTLAPIPIGLAVFAAHVVCIPVTGCSINPTRSFGPALVSDTWDDHWLFWMGPLTGALVASLTWLLLKQLDPNPAAGGKVLPPVSPVAVADEPKATQVEAFKN